MKFAIGFLVGLLTGMLLILGPIVAVLVSIGLVGQSSNEPDEPTTTTEETPAS